MNQLINKMSIDKMFTSNNRQRWARLEVGTFRIASDKRAGEWGLEWYSDVFSPWESRRAARALPHSPTSDIPPKTTCSSLSEITWGLAHTIQSYRWKIFSFYWRAWSTLLVFTHDLTIIDATKPLFPDSFYSISQHLILWPVAGSKKSN
jgi:hypothetical protein